MKRLIKLINKKEQGLTLIEVILALMILGIVASFLYGGIFVTQRGAQQYDTSAFAESLARNQMEYTKKQPYQYGTQYAPAVYENFTIDPDELEGYTISATGIPLSNPDNNIQKLTVTVTPPAGSGVLVLQDYKVNR